MQARKSDQEANNGYAKRRFFDLKTSILIITAMFGTGGITGLTSYLTDPNIRVQTKVESLNTISQKHELRITTIAGELERRKMRMENYVKTQEDKEELKQQLIDQEFKHIKDLLIEIKSDLKALRNGQ